VAPLELEGRPLALEPDRPLALSWRPGDPGPARLEVSLDIDQHGVTPATLVCESADSGSFEIPAELLGKLLAAGVSGFPKLRLSRQTVDSATVPPGCVELIVGAPAEPALTVARHTPCRADTDCPDRRCNLATQSCL
jgi:hypothetical protein